MLDVKSKLDRSQKPRRGRPVAAVDIRGDVEQGQWLTRPILVTGAAGFIGFHVARRLLQHGRTVVGLDNLNAYYDPEAETGAAGGACRIGRLPIRQARSRRPRRHGQACSREHRFPHVVHLAAQAGVRYSLIDPYAYVDANLVGFTNILEGCRHHGCRHLLFASSSSVYGGNTHMPFSVHDNVDHPLNLYGATKKANELMAHAYAHLFRLPTTGLRFFTVYGPWGRPDMAMWLFTAAIIAGQPIKLFNRGNMRRDFTYVDDVVESVVRLIDRAAQADPKWDGDAPDPGSSSAPWRVYNIGNNNPVELMEVVRLLEEAIGKKAVTEMLPMQPGDVPATYADIDDLARDVGFRPSTPIKDGIEKFVTWYRDYHRV